MCHARMDSRPDRQRRHPARVRRAGRGTSHAARLRRVVLGLAALAFFGVALLALAGTLALTLGGGPDTQAAGTLSAGDDGWTPLRSTAPDDVLAAVSQSPLLVQGANGGGDTPISAARLGTPVLVHGLAARSGAALPDVFVVPLLDGTGRVQQAAEAELNAGHTALHVTTVVTFTKPRSPALVAMSAAAAIARLTRFGRAHHLAPRPGSQPTLIYFPADALAQTTGKAVWRAGGEDPANPIWRIPASDGRDYFVGANGAVYMLGQLPLAASV